MKTNSRFESDLGSPAAEVFADISNLIAAAPHQYSAHPPTPGDALVEWPALGGDSFADTNPWPRGGLNE